MPASHLLFLRTALRLFFSHVLPCALALLLAACVGLKPQRDNPSPGGNVENLDAPRNLPPNDQGGFPPPMMETPPSSANSSGIGNEGGGQVNPLPDANGDLLKRSSLYFDFNRFEVRADQRAVMEAHARYLAQNPGRAVRLEGNTDERGSREYNLALGQKRAEAVVRAMQTYGVKDAQAEPVSNGKEKPKDEGHNETAWAENRRVDIVYTK